MAIIGSSWNEDDWMEDDGPMFGGAERMDKRRQAKALLEDRGEEVTKESVNRVVTEELTDEDGN